LLAAWNHTSEQDGCVFCPHTNHTHIYSPSTVWHDIQIRLCHAPINQFLSSALNELCVLRQLIAFSVCLSVGRTPITNKRRPGRAIDRSSAVMRCGQAGHSNKEQKRGKTQKVKHQSSPSVCRQIIIRRRREETDSKFDGCTSRKDN